MSIIFQDILLMILLISGYHIKIICLINVKATLTACVATSTLSWQAKFPRRPVLEEEQDFMWEKPKQMHCLPVFPKIPGTLLLQARYSAMGSQISPHRDKALQFAFEGSICGWAKLFHLCGNKICHAMAPWDLHWDTQFHIKPAFHWRLQHSCHHFLAETRKNRSVHSSTSVNIDKWINSWKPQDFSATCSGM